MAGKILKLTSSVRDQILERLSNGDMLADICAGIGINRTSVYRYTQRNRDFGEMYDRAHRVGIEAFLEDARNDLKQAGNRDEILRSKELLRHAEWRAEKLLARYQPISKQEVLHKGPMVIGWRDDPLAVVADDELVIAGAGKIH
jgi:ribosomal protein L30E